MQMAKAVSSAKITDIMILCDGKEYTFKIHESEQGGYWARCNELPEAITQAKSLDELAKNMQQVLTLALRPVPSHIRKKLESKKTIPPIA